MTIGILISSSDSFLIVLWSLGIIIISMIT